MLNLKYATTLLLSLNIIQTLRINFKCLDLAQAIKLPILIFGKASIGSLSGEIIIDAPIKTGLLCFGHYENRMHWIYKERSYITLEGILRLKGKVRIAAGSRFYIKNTGNLTIGDNTCFNHSFYLQCETTSVIGSSVGWSWNGQFIDSDSHYLMDTATKTVSPYVKPINIGSRCWIGNNVTISKGCIIPDNIVIAQNSFLNKNYSSVMPYSILAGSPAKIVRSNKQRIFSSDIQGRIDTFFTNNHSISEYIVQEQLVD